MADDALADVKRALVALRAAKARIQELERARSEPIAVVGVGCRFPGGADSLDALWSMLVERRDGLSKVPADRWDADAWYHPDPATPGRSVVRRGGFLSDIDQFDPDFFGLSEREAAQIDPQQRLLMEVSAEALERAGQPLDRLRGSRTGVFVGICASDFAQRTMFSGQAERIDAHTGTGSAISMAAGRLAYTFGLEGPAFTVDTACSSSLVAVHLACQALRGGECDLALAGGVNVMLSPLVTVFFSRMGVLSPSGRIRAFDASADGYLRSDGCGVVALRRLSDATRDGDPILAVILGSATGQNGRGNGLTAPNGRAQEATIRRALEGAGKAPDDVGYVEAFGAATPLGDRIELEALDRVFGRARPPLFIGSIKTNLGHSEGAGGMASLVKAVLAVERGAIPPTLNWERPPPNLPWDDMALRVPVTPVPWDGPRIAGVSAFGFSGTNAHIVVGEAPPDLRAAPHVGARFIAPAEAAAPKPPVAPGTPAAPNVAAVPNVGARFLAPAEAVTPKPAAGARIPSDVGARFLAPATVAEAAARSATPAVPIAISGRTEPDVRERARRLLADPGLIADLADIAATLGRRAHRPARSAFVACNHEDLRAGLESIADGRAPVSICRQEPVIGASAAAIEMLRGMGIDADVVDGDVARYDLVVSEGEPASRWVALFLAGARPSLDLPGARVIPLSPSPFYRSRHWIDDIPGVAPTAARPTVPVPSAFSVDQLAGLDEDGRTAHLAAWLRSLLAGLMGKDPASLDVLADLTDQGLDSLVAVDTIGRVLVELGVQLYPTELFEHGTITALSRHLARAMAGEDVVASDADHRAARGAIEAYFGASTGSTVADAAGSVSGRSTAEEADSAAVAGSMNRAPTGREGGGEPIGKLPGPIFVLSSPRAGSTLLRVMLAGHPGLFAPPELHLLLAEDLDAWHRRLSPELLTLGLAQAWMGLGLSESDALARVDDAVAARMPSREMYAALIARLGDRRLVDKSPSYGFDPAALARAERWFEGARFVHLVRHPYAVIESFARLRMGRLVGAGEALPAVAGEQAWTLSAERIGTFLAGIDPSRWTRVRYEDLVSDPASTMRQLCGFLGLPPNDAMLQPYRGDRMVPSREGRPSFLGDPGFSRHGRIDATLGDRWRDTIPAAPLQPEAARIARSFGYDLPDGLTVDLPADIRVVPTERAKAAGEAGARNRAPAPGLAKVVAGAMNRAPTFALGRFGQVLLTGATGFLGTWILADLLDTTDTIVHALVRAPSVEAGRERLRSALAAIGRSYDERRVRVVPGDLALPSLGLDRPTWDALARDVDGIVHNGAVVHFSMGRRQLSAPNIGGTLEVLRLAAVGGKPVVHVSTKGVFSPRSWPGDGPIGEDEPLRPIDARSTGYQQTKWAAERLVAAARDRGIPTAIVRPGRIGGDRRSGRVPEDDLLVRFVRGCVEVGAAPDVGGVVEVVPVDVVSRAIVDLLATPCFGRTFHLMHPEPLSVADATACVRDAGFDVALVPYAEWRSRLVNRVTSGKGSVLGPVLAMFGESPPDRVDDRRFSADNTRELLGSIAVTSIAEQLALTVRHLADRGLLPKA